MNPSWIAPEKYLIGPKQFIDNALSYELENDARIDELLLSIKNVIAYNKEREEKDRLFQNKVNELKVIFEKQYSLWFRSKSL
jgi:hypothetical protein